MISLRCPHCKVGLKVDETKIPPDRTSFACPKCKQTIPVSLLTQPDSGPETQLIHPRKVTTGRLQVVAAEGTPEQMFPLSEGMHLIGRKSSNPADTVIQIETTDRSMSREHIRIDVKKDAKGAFKHYLSDNNSKNHTLYNNSYLGEGEVVVLNDKDEIVIGRTILRFNI